MIKHFLAYGNSDQASFRSPVVKRCFDVMTVPGTIAAYYQDATAAFVLSSDISYMIDPRTPLFQGRIDTPKPSHVALAEWHGEHILRAVTAAAGGVPRELGPSDFDDPAILNDMVDRVVREQAEYASRAGGIQSKIDRYRQLLAEARGLPASAQVSSPAPPAAVIAPYFAVRSTSDAWWSVNERIWARCIELRASLPAVMPVVPVGDVGLLEGALKLVPGELGTRVFFWVTGFDERRAFDRDLETLWETIEGAAGRGLHLANMYGGYFSILLAKAGLAAFGNGLTYSESRAWPALASTGAAPARYYVPALHAFVAPALAQALLDLAPGLRCGCGVCSGPSGPSSVAGLTYHELKEHFASARQWERELVDVASIGDLRDQLIQAVALVRSVEDRLPPRSSIPTAHLDTWAVVLGRRA